MWRYSLHLFRNEIIFCLSPLPSINNFGENLQVPPSLSTMARPREPLRLNIPPQQQAAPFMAPPLFSPALPTALQGGMFPLRTPMQAAFFAPAMPGAPARPTHRGSASIAAFTPSAMQPTFPMHGHFPRPSLLGGQQSFPPPLPGQGPPFPGRNRRQPSIGGPPKAVLGGPARKLSPLPPVADAPAAAAPPVKQKKSIVKLPKETPKDDDGNLLEKPHWARRPLDEPFVYQDVDVVEAELTSAECYPPDNWRLDIPPTIDVFLPGKRAWQEIKKREIDEKLEKLGVERSASTQSALSHGPHARAASISSPADPALLFFKLNKLQQAQATGSLAPSTINSSSTSPQPPFAGLSPSPRLQPPRFMNRHGYSMSLAQPPTYTNVPTSNPFGPDALLPADQDSDDDDVPLAQIHAPQGRVPMSMSSLTAPRATSRPESRDSRPDFMRGFGLDATEEEDETEAEDSFVTNDQAEQTDDEDGDDGVQTARHSRHVSRLSAALSLQSVGGIVGNNINGGRIHERIDVEPIASGDESQDMELDQEVDVDEWTGSDDGGHQYQAAESSEDESLGDFSNPSDEERARQERVERRLQRRDMRLADQPRRVPHFPRPPDNTIIRRLDDDMISNPSEEEAMHQYYTSSPARRPSQGLSLPPHSRATSGNFTTHDPAQAHSRLPSDNLQSYALNPHAKPFVFAAPVSPFVFGAPAPPKAPLITHSRLPSLGTSLNPTAMEFKPSFALNTAAPEFKPGAFTFKPPAGVPHVAFPEPQPLIQEQPTAESTPFKTQGREKRQRLSIASDSEEDNAPVDQEEDQQSVDNMTSFKFPSNNPSPEKRLNIPLNPEADTFRFGGAIGNVPLLPSLMPLSPGTEEADMAKIDMPVPEHLVLPTGRTKRAPIPLDFTHGASPSLQLDFRSSTTVPAGLFKAAANGNGNASSGDERTRRTVRSRLSSREFMDSLHSSRSRPHSQRPSLDDLNVPPISVSRKISRSRLADTSAGPADDVFTATASVRRPVLGSHGRKRSSLPDPLRDATNSSVSDEDESVALDLTTRLEVHHYEQRLEALLDEKLDSIKRDLLRSITAKSGSNAEAMMAEVVQLLRSRQENSQLDARGELDFELIKDIVQSGHAESRALLQRELAQISMRGDAGAGVAIGPMMQELNNRTIDAVVESIHELSVRLEAISVGAPARERDSMVDALMSALSPTLNALHPESVDYDYLTDKLTQAVKPHISQLIDLASDKRETAGLIIERILPLLPSNGSNNSAVDTDAIARQLTSEVRKAIAPIDAFEIKEQVADLVVERLDSRLAVRDRTFGPDIMASKVADGVSRLMQPLDQLSSLVESHKSLASQQAAIASSHKEVADAVSGLPKTISDALESMKAATAATANGHVHPHSEPSNEHVIAIKTIVDNLAGGQKSLGSNARELLALQKEVLEQVAALPETLAAATNILHGAHAEFALTRDANKREMDELRRNNTEFQVQMAKARGAHGQVRVEKEVVVEKLSIVEGDRDRMRAQLKEAQVEAAETAATLSVVEARNVELEDALAKALARLQASDATHQANQERIQELEKGTREVSSERATLKAKADALELQVTFAARDKESALQSLASLQKQHDQLASQQSHWDDLRHASAQIEMLTSLIGQADNEELKELRVIRDRSKVLEGEHAALLKRFRDQESKIASSDKAALAARQSLAQAQQRAGEWERRAKEYEGQLEMTKTKLDQAEQTHTRLDTDFSLLKLQLDEREADERLTKDRENKLRDQINTLETRLNQQQIELERSRAKTPTKAAPSPYRNGTSRRPDSRASTVYPSRPSSPSASARSATPPGQQSVWDSMHAPRGFNSTSASIHATSTPTPAGRYGALNNNLRRPTAPPKTSNSYSRYPKASPAAAARTVAPPSPTPSTVSLAPTQGADGWWS
ncbi:hypothetical protein MIND_00428700 [Mycena indigotica]|uniref:Uncharacterized protein n=1 Tax=Mycena indigotica TaxID=2126181 RepID=A0A8H6SWF0_9AGAR|nr:uncharacterized protein MIND_00428700 [Mycena indigotica]KAF7306375.1 hypothetical protein MIND_00428700 [Mycena indigotica]